MHGFSGGCELSKLFYMRAKAVNQYGHYQEARKKKLGLLADASVKGVALPRAPLRK